MNEKIETLTHQFYEYISNLFKENKVYYGSKIFGSPIQLETCKNIKIEFVNHENLKTVVSGQVGFGADETNNSNLLMIKIQTNGTLGEIGLQNLNKDLNKVFIHLVNCLEKKDII